jgi:hypothetical protein
VDARGVEHVLGQQLIGARRRVGKVDLFDLAQDPGEKNDVAAANPEVVKDLQARLLRYAQDQAPAEWIKAQPGFLGAQGKTVLDPDFDIDDGGLPREKPILPRGPRRTGRTQGGQHVPRGLGVGGRHAVALHEADRLALRRHAQSAGDLVARTHQARQAEVVLTVDGKAAARTTVERTVPAAFTASETFDVGVDLGSPVSLAYFDKRPFQFDGEIEAVTVSLK